MSDASQGHIEWWAGIQRAELAPVFLPNDQKTPLVLVVAPAGILFGPVGQDKSSGGVAWDTLRKIEVGNYHLAPKGKRHSAFGFGPLGVAFVGVNALHNAKVGHGTDCRLIRLTYDKGAVDLLTMKSRDEIVAALGPAADALNAHLAAPPKPAAATPPTSSMADELAKLVNFHNSGVLTDEEFAAQKAKLLA